MGSLPRDRFTADFLVRAGFLERTTALKRDRTSALSFFLVFFLLRAGLDFFLRLVFFGHAKSSAPCGWWGQHTYMARGR